MSRNKKKSSNKRKLHKASKKVNQDQTSTTPTTQISQTSTPKKGRFDIDYFALFHSVIQRCIIYTYYIKKIY